MTTRWWSGFALIEFLVVVAPITILTLGRTRLPTPHLPLPAHLSPPPRPRTPSQVAWQTAQWQWMLAQQAVCRQIEALEEWDPEAMNGSAPEVCRRQLLARDASGGLRRAREAAIQAQTLAQTPREAYRATLLRLRLEREAGHHQAELQQARRLLQLAPESESAWWCLQRAMRDIL
jgi:hypothetical protein